MSTWGGVTALASSSWGHFLPPLPLVAHDTTVALVTEQCDAQVQLVQLGTACRCCNQNHLGPARLRLSFSSQPCRYPCPGEHHPNPPPPHADSLCTGNLPAGDHAHPSGSHPPPRCCAAADVKTAPPRQRQLWEFACPGTRFGGRQRDAKAAAQRQYHGAAIVLDFLPAAAAAAAAARASLGSRTRTWPRD